MSDSTRDRAGEVRIRSNVTFNREDTHLIPGEIARGIHRDDMTRRQRDEKGYYVPCAVCQRTIFEIMRDGCEPCGPKQPAISPEAASARRVEFAALVAPNTWLAADLEATRTVSQVSELH